MPPPDPRLPGLTRGRPVGAAIYEAIAMALAVLPAVAGPVLFGAVSLWAIAPLMACAWVAAALTALRPVIFRAVVPVSCPPGLLAGVAFLLYVTARIPFAVAPYEAMLRALMIGSGLAAYWTIANLAGRQGRWKWVLGLLLTAAALNGLYAWTQHAQGSRMVLGVERHPSYMMRMGGTYICPNHFANLLAMAVAIAPAILAAPEAGWTLRVVAIYALLLIPWPLVLSQSRSGFAVAVAGAMAVGWMMTLRRSLRAAAAGILGLTLAGVLAVTLVWWKAPDLRERLERSPSDFMARTAIWRGTIDMIRSAPWWGHGGGSFHLIDSLYVRIPPGQAAVHAHNDYLHVAAEYGLVGLGLSAIAGVALAGGFLRCLRKTRKEGHARLAAGALAVLLAATAQALVDFNLHIYGNSMVLLAMLGSVAAVLHAADELPNRLLPPRLARWIPLVVATVASGAATLSVRAGVASVWTLHRGDPALKEGDLDRAAIFYERARRWDPWAWEPWVGLAHLELRRAQLANEPEVRALHARRALDLATEGRRHNPREVGFDHIRSQAFSLLGDQEAALDILRRIVAEHPNRPYFLARLGIQLDRMGRLPEAAEALRAALKHNPDDDSVRRYLQVVELRLKSAPPAR